MNSTSSPEGKHRFSSRAFHGPIALITIAADWTKRAEMDCIDMLSRAHYLLESFVSIHFESVFLWQTASRALPYGINGC